MSDSFSDVAEPKLYFTICEMLFHQNDKTKMQFFKYTLRKKGSLGFFTQLQITFYAKKGSIMTRKNPFDTKFFF